MLKKNDFVKTVALVFMVIGLLFLMFGDRSMETSVVKEAEKMIERHEGKRLGVYDDSRFIPTIGIGFNLHNANARNRIESLGVSYDDILAGKTSLTEVQVDYLFKQDVQTALNNAKIFLPSFDKQPKDIQIVLIDMSFNMGLTTLNRFVKFRQALTDKDYQLAAIEMKDSKWYNQVGNRSKELVAIVHMTTFCTSQTVKSSSL